MPARSLITTVTLVVLAVLLPSSPALATGDDDWVGGALLPDGAEVIAGDGTSLAGVNSTAGSGGALRCRWFLAWLGVSGDPRRDGQFAGAFELNEQGWTQLGDPEDFTEGDWATLLHQCERVGTGDVVASEWVEVALPLSAAPEVAVEDLVEIARREIRLPLPAPGMNPPGDQVVNLASWLWIENWTSITASASAGAVSASVSATPATQRWDFGDRVVECSGPGVAYDPSMAPEAQVPSCSHTFHRPFPVLGVEVSVEWEVTWSASTGAGGVLGTVSRSTAFDLAVVEVQALNT